VQEVLRPWFGPTSDVVRVADTKERSKELFALGGTFGGAALLPKPLDYAKATYQYGTGL